MLGSNGPGEDAVRLLEKNVAEVRAAIADSCRRAGRAPDSVALLPVTKYVGPDVVRLLYRAGIRDAGEGTVQGALEKAAALADLPDLRIHLVGHLQRNKARKAVAIVASIHSVDSMRLAAKLEEDLAGVEPLRPALYLEIHNGVETSKGGIPPDGAAAFLGELRASCPRVFARVVGLMLMAPESGGAEGARPHFRRLRELRDRLVAAGDLRPDAGLSMGMSADFPVAVEEGATVVRVGTRLLEGILLPHALPHREHPPGGGGR